MFFFFLFSSHTEKTQYIGHWSQKYTANKEKQNQIKFLKKPQRKETDSGQVYICLPQPLPEAKRLLCLVRVEASGVRWTVCVSSVLKLSSYTLNFPKRSPARPPHS